MYEYIQTRFHLYVECNNHQRNNLPAYDNGGAVFTEGKDIQYFARLLLDSNGDRCDRSVAFRYG